jgi:hypothetical protein
MRKLVLTVLLFVVSAVSVFACPVCERNKPKILQGVTAHGSRPDSNWDYVIVLSAIVLLFVSLFYAVKWLVNPKERNSDHIKYSIIK